MVYLGVGMIFTIDIMDGNPDAPEFIPLHEANDYVLLPGFGIAAVFWLISWLPAPSRDVRFALVVVSASLFSFTGIAWLAWVACRKRTMGY